MVGDQFEGIVDDAVIGFGVVLEYCFTTIRCLHLGHVRRCRGLWTPHRVRRHPAVFQIGLFAAEEDYGSDARQYGQQQ